MPGKEELPHNSKEGIDSQSLEVQPEETQLSQLEVNDRAAQLISSFKQALKGTPEFIRELQTFYFAEGPYHIGSKGDRVEFGKGGFRYGVLYNKNIINQQEVLNIQKFPDEPTPS
jgi:hypothetical protein